jgi:hypothetical protein
MDIEEVVKELNETNKVIDLRLSKIEVDLRHHIKRSDKHERWMMTLIILLSGSVGAGIIQLVPLVKALLP